MAQEIKDLRLSHSSLSSFRHCEQKFYYEYVRGIESLSNRWQSSMDLGSAVHAGIEAALWELWEDCPATFDRLVHAGRKATIKWVDDNTDKNRKDWTGNRDVEYYAEMQFIREAAPKLIELHLPLTGIGTRYRPVGTNELWEVPEGYEEPIIEYEFVAYDTVGNRKREIEGIVDAVLYDMDTDSYVLFDWKCRGRLLDEQSVAMDSQLVLYATVLNAQITTGISIDFAVMYQMLNQLPSPAKLTKKGLPSKARSASYFEYWWDSIPEKTRKKLDYNEWYAEMVGNGKMRELSDWVSEVQIPITGTAMQEASVNTERTINRIEQRMETSDWVRSWSAYDCALCPFKTLCVGVRQGLDEEAIIKEGYQERNQ